MCYEGFAVVQAGCGGNLDYWHRSSRDVDGFKNCMRYN